MRLLDRTHGKHTTERALDPGDHELLEQLEVPDDLSGIEHIPSIGEDAHEPDAEPRRAAPMVRWLGWMSVCLLAMAGLIAGLAMLTNGDDPVAPTVETPVWETEGPGSNSLHASWLDTSEVPWLSEFDGPGGGSMNAVPVVLVQQPPLVSGPEWSQTDGPGGTSVGMTPPPVPWSFDTGGPGSNSQ